jgi:hypothetical protein
LVKLSKNIIKLYCPILKLFILEIDNERRGLLVLYKENINNIKKDKF